MRSAESVRSRAAWNRARGRALHRLRKKHETEFMKIMEEELQHEEDYRGRV